MYIFVQSEAYMNCRPPVIAPSALGNQPPVQNRDSERERETERERVREREIKRERETDEERMRERRQSECEKER